MSVKNFQEGKDMEIQHDSMQILFIRHAETNYNDIGDRDPSDGELTPSGELQCVDLGEKLRDLSIEAYITSSLLRSFKTAVGVCNAKTDKPLLEICPELVECGCTPGYYGCSLDSLKELYTNVEMCPKLFGTEEYEFGCEAVEDNNQRAQKLVDYVINTYGFGKRVAVFSHHGMLEYLIPTALGVKTRDFFFALDNISVTAIDICRDGRKILRYVNK